MVIQSQILQLGCTNLLPTDWGLASWRATLLVRTQGVVGHNMLNMSQQCALATVMLRAYKAASAGV